MELKKLVNIVVAKHENAPKVKISEIPKNMTINEKNKLQIDKINASRKSQKNQQIDIRHWNVRMQLNNSVRVDNRGGPVK